MKVSFELSDLDLSALRAAARRLNLPDIQALLEGIAEERVVIRLRKVDWSSADFSKPNWQIAQELGVDPATVSVNRRKRGQQRLKARSLAKSPTSLPQK